MMRIRIAIGAGLLTFLLGATLTTSSARAARPAQPATPAPQDQQKPAYTLAEYNAYQAAAAEQNPQMKISKLDAFVMQYPMSTLLPYVYVQYYNTYLALKNYAATIESSDKLLAMGDKIANQDRLQAEYARAQAYYLGSSSDKTLQTPEAATQARDAAKAGLAALDMLKKPDNVTDDQFAQQKKSVSIVFNTIVATAATTLKDYPGAADAYKTLLMLNPNDAISHFRLGVVDLQLMPPDANGGFWEMARSLGLKSPQGPNDGQVRMYMLNQLTRYQQASCDKLMGDEVNDMIMLASTTADRPATFNVPSAMDLDKARNDTANFLPTLQMGGDAGKVMWLATCGLEFPDILVKVMDNPTVDGDNIAMNVYRPVAQDPTAAQAEMDAATMPNMQIKIMGQPDASRVSKDDLVRFTGTLTAYTQSPFLLTWDKAKINDEDIPAEKGKKAAGGAGRKAPAKKPE